VDLISRQATSLNTDGFNPFNDNKHLSYNNLMTITDMNYNQE